MSTRHPRAGERFCEECGGDGTVEAEEAPQITDREEPRTRLVSCDACGGTGVAPCGAGCGETVNLDAAGICPACADEDARSEVPDSIAAMETAP